MGTVEEIMRPMAEEHFISERNALRHFAMILAGRPRLPDLLDDFSADEGAKFAARVGGDDPAVCKRVAKELIGWLGVARRDPGILFLSNWLPQRKRRARMYLRSELLRMREARKIVRFPQAAE
jgi:hypothetical protein